ncbi:radical SAM/SPASM domain-containing protein [Desulfovibrio psychrotolerans]|uniref:Radical SAM protein n=1 Tax=Desulfovibrio psychrotolerans TaxID=415242 RepID=A0A7J0BWQ3_9BACT|nr:radical SAM/SPASM domain-containing protein [Desulfovibrio psychrotolerans]GFM38128.1 hypothetical protein DSM19430T_28120 [Desulfovibrio psychrotolerans]
MQRFIDPSTRRKRKIIADRISTVDGVPVFSIVEFNIHGSCTRACPFCPFYDPAVYKKNPVAMDFGLYQKIIRELESIQYAGKILYSGFCEPLLNKHITEFIAFTRKTLPNSRIEMVTNGDLLTKEVLLSLLDASLDTINISIYDGPAEAKQFELLVEEANVPEGAVVLRRRYKTETNFGMTISNRSGLINSNAYRDENETPPELPLHQPCYYPFYMIMVDVDGSPLLCPHDWKKLSGLGNLKTESLLSVWNSKKMNAWRKRLINCKRDFDPCALCDVDGLVMGEEHFQLWRESLGE